MDDECVWTARKGKEKEKKGEKEVSAWPAAGSPKQAKAEKAKQINKGTFP